MAETEPDKIVVAGIELSPLQYRWLFDDLVQAISTDDEGAALSHYRDRGHAEIEAGNRPFDEERLTLLKLQRWSPSIPGAVPSKYFRLHSGRTSTFDVVFTFTFMPEGFFNFSEFVSGNTTLFINTSQNDFYQRGVPGVTGDIDETAQWLGSIIAAHGPKCVRVFGASMGGYAALLYGALLDADAVYVTAPLVLLGEEGCRSLTWNDVQVYDAKYISIAWLLPRLVGKVYAVFPLFNLFEYKQIDEFQACLGTEPLFVHDFHPGAASLDWQKIMSTPELLSFGDGITFTHCSVSISQETIKEAVGVDHALRNRDLQSAADGLERLLGENVGNHGFRYFLGALRFALKDEASGMLLLRAFAENSQRFRLNQEFAVFRAAWRDRLLEDFSRILSAGVQRQLLESLTSMWIDAAKASGFLPVKKNMADTRQGN